MKRGHSDDHWKRPLGFLPAGHLQKGSGKRFPVTGQPYRLSVTPLLE